MTKDKQVLLFEALFQASGRVTEQGSAIRNGIDVEISKIFDQYKDLISPIVLAQFMHSAIEDCRCEAILDHERNGNNA